MKPITEEPFYCAIDVSKDKLDVSGVELALPGQLDNNLAGFRQVIKAARKYPGRVQFVFESTATYHLGLALALWEAQLPLSILNPARVRHYAKALGKAKTDPLDKELIGAFARSSRPQPTPAPDATLRELSELLQRRDSLIASRAAEQARLAQSRHKLVRHQIDSSIRQLTQQLKQIDQLMAKLVASSAQLQLKVKVLCQVSGVGLLTAVTLLITLPELGTLARNRIARLVGLAPLNDDSGKRSGKRFIQGGRFRPRCALYMASVTASIHNPILRTLYQRLLKAGKAKKVALTALMRKLLVHLNSLMRQQLAT
jgi:transposase